jgi:hypothetical protein
MISSRTIAPERRHPAPMTVENYLAAGLVNIACGSAVMRGREIIRLPIVSPVPRMPESIPDVTHLRMRRAGDRPPPAHRDSLSRTGNS